MHRIDGAGHVNNRFVSEDISTHRPPTEITADIMNAFQEELANVIDATGQALDKTNNAQLLAALRGGELYQTPPQFDSSRKAATTEFVQRALGNLSGFLPVSASTTLAKSQAGKLVQIENQIAAGQTITLPLVDGLPNGACFWMYNTSLSQKVTIAANGENIFTSGGSSLAMNPGEYAIFEAQPPGQWNVLGTISAIHFKASLYGIGYQRLPSGLILQWGNIGSNSDVVFPVAFSTAVFIVLAHSVAAGHPDGLTNVETWVRSMSATGCSIGRANNQVGAYWLAIGY
jgi:hypothetical protein